MKVHFVGINGSGASGVAIAAAKMGFQVSGCDHSADTPYSAQIAGAGIPVIIGHDAAHVDDADIVTASPALTTQSENIPEIAAAAAAGKLMKWQEFLGKYILPGRKLIAVCGTHGKTTTSAMVAHILEYAGLDPTAFIGAIVPAWNSSNRFGASDWTVLEADEYANNFESYRPQITILNNLEMEHPEYFRDYEHYKKTFRDFLANATGMLIYNADDAGVLEVIDSFSGEKIPFSIHGIKITADANGQSFDGFEIKLLGVHNVSNAMAAISVARKVGINDDIIRDALSCFRGTGHRLEKVYESTKITIYDDYAHHHTQAKKTIEALRASYPDARLTVVYEPHQISRYTQNTVDTLAGLSVADMVFIMEFWRGRESNLSLPDVTADIERFGAKNIRYIPNTDEVLAVALSDAHSTSGKSVILVMGAGASWKIAKRLKEELEI
ncbi:MAG: Mur ligase family protein [Alphaproteobacteria bacterium]|nr:Mur ligase family protein [Alphaproteobacteria bacterium]